ncbi:ion transporter [candidate division KSB1 bacterium]|nr:ion transporter [candidate division KSB1 bacterium]
MSNKNTTLKKRLYQIIFKADTFGGKLFDIVLIISIISSVCVVMLLSVNSVRNAYGNLLYTFEWFFTILFTIEYITRLYSSPSTWKYVKSFYGLVDLLAIIPTFLDFLWPGTHYLLVIRVLRVLRIFRIMKLATYLGEANMLLLALRNSRRKVIVFFLTVLTLVVILGSLMYLIEGESHGFTSIPKSVYWAIVTLTTVGYGDISPKTEVGQALASFIMILGYSILAVPTGIVTVELGQAMEKERKKGIPSSCVNCNETDHDRDAQYCKRCGYQLNTNRNT